MSNHTTQCPHCSARFLISNEQLQQRGGKARCGQCQQVFQANENIIAPPKEQPPTPQATNLEYDGPVTNPSYAKLMAVQASQANEQANELISDDTLIDDDTAIADDTLIDDYVGSEYVEAPRKEGKIQPTSVSSVDTSAIFGTEISDDFRNTLSNMPAVQDDPFSNIDTSDTVKSVSDEQWLESLLEEDEEQPLEKTKEEESEDLIGFLEDIGANTSQFSAVSPAQLRPDSSQIINTPMIETEKEKISLPIGKIIGTFVWLLLSAIMLLVLAGQYLYFNADTLSRDAEGRKHLETACSFIDCKVANVSADAISFKDVDSEDVNGASVLSFVIHNESKERTLFPAIKVSLLKDEKIVGENIVLPPDYLTSNQKSLPAIQPINAKVKILMSKSKYDSIRLEALY